MLSESEARKLAVVFEEVAREEYKQDKKAESSTRPGQHITGLQSGFEEDFLFGNEDTNDYYDRPDITKGVPIVD